MRSSSSGKAYHPPTLDVELGSHALLRRHATTFQDPELVPASIQHDRSSVRALQEKLQPSAATAFGNQLVLHRDAVDADVYFSGGIPSLLDAESVVMEYFDVADLIAGSMVCRRWRGLCRQDGLWSKLLVSPVERYPLRALLNLQDTAIPSIQVYMLYHACGLRAGQYVDVSESIHLGGGVPSHHVTPFGPWLAAQSTPLRPPMLRAICRQLLLACLSVERMNLTLDGVAFDTIVLHHVVGDNDDVPLLQLTSLAHERERFHRRNEDDLLRLETIPSSILLSFLYVTLDVALGREFIRENLVRRLLHDSQHIASELKSLIEYGVFLLARGLPASRLLMHPFFQDPSTSATASLLWPTDLHRLVTSSSGYLSAILAWFTTHHMPTSVVAQSPLLSTCRVDLTLTSSSMIPRTAMAKYILDAPEVQPQDLVRLRYASLAAPPTVDAAWLCHVATYQHDTLTRLDLSRAQVPTSTIVRALAALHALTDLLLPVSIWQHHVETVVEAFPHATLSHLARVDSAFLAALTRLDRSYESQLQIMHFAYGHDDDDAKMNGPHAA
ncbi:Aste57867_3515 [Aphanomyces stellatus]|uniref:Aste57867_3515 protein n=1 Tax=Aphanomyces stellatus TaxID=120398 RepID=A0A485K9V1_9STRA|nr:hypothetical protein As57867_003504 [Aphanomyces stellatus]VFT80678.1 Aste57867_3515 [Aphanomyces stellatus]